MKLLSWNVNGLRACLGKGFADSVERLDADIVCLQETRMDPGQAMLDLHGRHPYWNSAQKKGYSGVAVFSREKPLDAWPGMGLPEHDREGRILTLAYPDFTLINVYTPNSRSELSRLAYRMEWEDAFRAYAANLDLAKPVVICGDLNVAHAEIDLRHPAANRRHAGFTDEERGKMTELLSAGFADTFRALHPDTRNAYTWWSFRGNARANNTGWRIDYFLASARLLPRVAAASIHPEVPGSDHCPVSLDISTH